MKILITGGAGFIGSAVVRLALSQGHSVVNLDSLTYASCIKNLDCVSVNPKYFFERVNICDRSELKRIFDHYCPDAVIHLAAESHVDRSIDEPSIFIQTNIIGTFNLLESAMSYWNGQGRPETFRFHHVSTDEVFGSLPLDSNTRFTEDTPYDPSSAYSATKAGSDHLVRAWYKTYGLPVVLTNCSNNYGPYQFPEKLVPIVILNALTGNPLPIYGDGSNIRDWLFVDDHANALLLVLKNGDLGRSYNIGGGNELTNLELVQKICRILDRVRPRHLGSYVELITFVADRPGHDARYSIDSSRICDELSWRPSFSIDEGLEYTVQWFLENEDWWRPLLKRSGLGLRLGKKY